MEEQKTFSKVEKRWIVREIQAERMSLGEAKEHLVSRSKNPEGLIRSWMKDYSSDIDFTLPLMTEKEKAKLDAAHKRMKELEKQLEHAQMKNIALETMIDIAEDTIRAMRGTVKPIYMDDPETMPAVQGVNPVLPYDPETNNWRIHWPIPVNIDYQVTTYSRQPRHDRQILSQILYTRIPMRFAILEPDDGNSAGVGTVRRLDLLDISKRDVTEQGKRLFVNAFTVRVSSEIAETTYNQLYKALNINVTGVTDAEGNTDGSHIIGRSEFTSIDSFTISQP